MQKIPSSGNFFFNLSSMRLIVVDIFASYVLSFPSTLLSLKRRGEISKEIHLLSLILLFGIGLQVLFCGHPRFLGRLRVLQVDLASGDGGQQLVVSGDAGFVGDVRLLEFALIVAGDVAKREIRLVRHDRGFGERSEREMRSEISNHRRNELISCGLKIDFN